MSHFLQNYSKQIPYKSHYKMPPNTAIPRPRSPSSSNSPMSVNTLQNSAGYLGDLQSSGPHKKNVGHRASFNTLEANGAAPNSKHGSIAPSEEPSLNMPRRSRGVSSDSINSASATAVTALSMKNGATNPEKVFQSYSEEKVKGLFEGLRNDTVRRLVVLKLEKA